MFLLHADSSDNNWVEFEEKRVKQCVGQYGQHFNLVDGWVGLTLGFVDAVDERIVLAL